MTANAQRVLVETVDGGRLCAAWRDEIHERIARIDAGETELVDADELERELWAEQLVDELSAARR